MITKEEVQHIAKLARLGLTENEIEKFRKELSSILDYVEKLKEVDVSGVEAEMQPLEGDENLSHLPLRLARDLEFAAREDGDQPIRRQEKKIERAKKLLKLAPETEDGYLKVKSIF